MEGKLTYIKTLTSGDAQKLFKIMLDKNSAFITVEKAKVQLQSGIMTKSELISYKFRQTKTDLLRNK